MTQNEWSFLLGASPKDEISRAEQHLYIARKRLDANERYQRCFPSKSGPLGDKVSLRNRLTGAMYWHEEERTTFCQSLRRFIFCGPSAQPRISPNIESDFDLAAEDVESLVQMARICLIYTCMNLICLNAQSKGTRLTASINSLSRQIHTSSVEHSDVEKLIKVVILALKSFAARFDEIKASTKDWPDLQEVLEGHIAPVDAPKLEELQKHLFRVLETIDNQTNRIHKLQEMYIKIANQMTHGDTDQDLDSMLGLLKDLPQRFYSVMKEAADLAQRRYLLIITAHESRLSSLKSKCKSIGCSSYGCPCEPFELTKMFLSPQAFELPVLP